ncbi:MAG: signal peptide peptidase SppA [Phycisphaerae bacterium]
MTIARRVRRAYNLSMNIRPWILTSLLGLLLVGCAPDAILIKPISTTAGLKERTVGGDTGWLVSNKIAVIDVDGLITNQREAGFLGMEDNPTSLFIEKLDRVTADEDVRAVVLRINSPGGGVTASDIMYHALRKLKQRRKMPVVSIIEDVGASGGYYLACGSDKILAHPTSVVGSIGVIIQTFSFAGTLNMLGANTQAIKSGKYKDMGSPLKPLSEDDARVFQNVVDDLYQRFLRVVDKGRPGMSAEDVASVADGKIFTAQEALDNGLIDAIGYMDDAISLARKQAGIEKARIVMYSRPYGSRPHVYAEAADLPTTQFNMINLDIPSLTDLTRPRVMYLWNGRQ